MRGRRCGGRLRSEIVNMCCKKSNLGCMYSENHFLNLFQASCGIPKSGFLPMFQGKDSRNHLLNRAHKIAKTKNGRKVVPTILQDG